MTNQFGKYLKEKRDEKGFTINQLSLYSGISAAQLSRIENGKRGVPKVENIQKLAESLSVPYDEIMRVAGYYKPSDTKQQEQELPELSEKDERDIAKDLEKMIKNLSNDDAYSQFDGRAIDEMDKEDRELLIASLENSLRMAKRMAKQKFTPHKYRR
ncbi:helix-turn-helix transcriptional regulator [Lentibacillus sp.]|uniref:helix-turn-helix domain-containing protein n=1 Tax=Lentibacillus sp. TaxID=1925746 RepID=UPI002B4AB4CC|nr:helix-turn-helix transcriptional regulator [Lentibacillus sp.]HLS08795.1 helix-turn-helix transcriptional regulator [Lentibacillus sp.]